MRIAEDVLFNQDYLIASKTVLFLDEYLYLYDCTNTNSLTRSIKSKENEKNIFLNRWQRECNNYLRYVRETKFLGCYKECITRLRKDLCYSLVKTEYECKSKPYWEDIQEHIKSFPECEDILRYSKIMKIRYYIQTNYTKVKKAMKYTLKMIMGS